MTDEMHAQDIATAKQMISEKRYDDAIQFLITLRSGSPDNPEILSLLGAAHAENKDYPQALAYFTSAAASSPSARAYYNLATAHKIMGDSERAKQDLDSALKVDPNYQRARQMLSQMGEDEPSLQAAPQDEPVIATRTISGVGSSNDGASSSASPSFDNLPTYNQHAGKPHIGQPQLVTQRNWGKVIGGGLLVGIPFLLLWIGWTGALSPMGGPILGAIASLFILGALTKWLANSAGAYETQHWIVMIILTGLIPALIMIKGFDLLAQGWYNMEKRRI